MSTPGGGARLRIEQLQSGQRRRGQPEREAEQEQFQRAMSRSDELR
jgi:hypothetical protein